MKNEIFEEKYRVSTLDVDSLGYMKMSRIFDVLHDVANHAMSPLHLDKETLIDKGLLWVIGEQTLEIDMIPRKDETITISTWVGKEFALFIPRFYEVANADGKAIIRASAIWAVIDSNSRKTIKPSSKDVFIPAHETGKEIGILNTPKALDITGTKKAKVLPEYIDFNNHMNNAKYFDIVDSIDPIVQGNRFPRKVIARYSSEAFLNDELTINYGRVEDLSYYSIDTGKTNHFKLRIEY